jgi:hypothetical protein
MFKAGVVVVLISRASIRSVIDSSACSSNSEYAQRGQVDRCANAPRAGHLCLLALTVSHEEACEPQDQGSLAYHVGNHL